MAGPATLTLLVVALGALAVWVGILLRLRRSVARLGWIREGLDLPAAPGLVTVVIPAHNEARVIDACAARLRAQDHPALRVIFVLDRCTDRTAEILRPHIAADPRLSVLEVAECPPEWAGKCHAAWRGARSALDSAQERPDWLIFTDADTRFAPGLVRAAVGCATARASDLLSLLPRLTSGRLFERVVQPVASMTLLRMYPVERVDHPRSPRAFANGQFMLFTRACYEAISGHDGVKDDLLEDLAFARRVVASGRRVSVLASGSMLEVSMYDSFDAFLRGWRRIFIEACHRKPGRLRKNAMRTLVVGMLMPILQVILLVMAITAMARGAGGWWAPVAVALVIAAWAAQATALLWIYTLQGAVRRWLVAYPVGCAVIAAILLRGASDLIHRRPVRWGGREYVLEPR